MVWREPGQCESKSSRREILMSPGLIINLGLIMETNTSTNHYPVQHGHIILLKHLYNLPHSYLEVLLRLTLNLGSFTSWDLDSVFPTQRKENENNNARISSLYIWKSQRHVVFTSNILHNCCALSYFYTELSERWDTHGGIKQVNTGARIWVP